MAFTNEELHSFEYFCEHKSSSLQLSVASMNAYGRMMSMRDSSLLAIDSRNWTEAERNYTDDENETNRLITYPKSNRNWKYAFMPIHFDESAFWLLIVGRKDERSLIIIDNRMHYDDWIQQIETTFKLKLKRIKQLLYNDHDQSPISILKLPSIFNAPKNVSNTLNGIVLCITFERYYQGMIVVSAFVSNGCVRARVIFAPRRVVSEYSIS